MSDFDDIFGDLKEDEQSSASLPSDYDDASIFGDAPSSSSNKLEAVTKPATDAHVPPAPARENAPATSSTAPPGKASHEPASKSVQDDDDFLSWLDDGGNSGDGATAPSMMMDDINLDAPAPASNGNAADAAAAPHASAATADVQYTAPPAPISIHVADNAAPAPLGETAHTVSLDDDDDDDDFLEKIVQTANRKAAGSSSRESSSSSLAIKSQSSNAAHQRAPSIDAKALVQTFVTTGVLPPASRLAVWCHALGASATQASISMYALQTTPLDLSNQPELRKEVEELCASVFASPLYLATIEASAVAGSGDDGSRLMFIDSAEILLTYACKQLALDSYPLGLALTLAPLLTTGGNDPLQLDLVATLLAVCRIVLPHLSKHVAVHAVADARRPMLKWLLQYHAPDVALHLDQHFHTWHLTASAPRRSNKTQTQTQAQQGGTGALLDSWVASMFECDGSHDFDFLVKVWDCCVLVDSSGKDDLQSATTAPSHASIAMCFAVVYLLTTSSATKKLLRMERDQLRHCMAQTLVDALQDVSGAQLLVGVQQLIATTPPSFCTKLRDVGYAPQAPMKTNTAASAATNEPLARRTSATNTLGMSSLLSASATGVKELSSAMIDMPTKLLAMGLAGSSSSPSSSSSKAAAGKDDTKTTSQLLQQLTDEATSEQATVAMRLAATDVIPAVFASFEASSPTAADSNAAMIRYFIIDCRSLSERRSGGSGQIPTAFDFDPDAVTDPLVLERVLATLNPMKRRVHLCVMGHGYGHVVTEIQHQHASATTAATVAAAAQSPFERQDDLLEAYAANLTRVHSALLFLTKQGFPFVSVLDGGFAAAHQVLVDSTQFTVDDLIDHDAPQCVFCEHHRCMAGASSAATTGSGRVGTTNSSHVPAAPATTGDTTSLMSEQKQQPSVNPSASPSTSQRTTASGQLDAKSLFDAHSSGSGSGGSYFAGFAGALKTSGKTLMNPTDSLKDSTKWLMKKTSSPSSSGGGNDAQTKPPLSVTASGSGTLSPDAKSANSAPAATLSMANAMPNFTKFRSSLVAMGSESLEMLKKAEQAAVAKTRVPFGGSATLSPPNTKASAGSNSNSAAGSASANANAATARTGSRTSDRAASFQQQQQRIEEEVFTIDDDDEEDDFVGGGGGGSGNSDSRTASTSSSVARNESFSRYNNSNNSSNAMPTSPPATTMSAVQPVEKGNVHLLVKGMRVSRTQMLPCVESPFFSGYKKKKLAVASGADARSASASRTSSSTMLPRRLVLAENHLVVLKAERNMDDVYQVKSCHPLAHIARMTCLKKNALMVTVYYKWKPLATSSSENDSAAVVVEKRNAYEVQQRDEFIKAIKRAMEKM